MSERLLTRLRESLEGGEFYEGLQQYKLHTARLANMSKREAVQIIITGCRDLLQHEQRNMAIELALGLKSAYAKLDVPYDATSIQEMRELSNIFSGFPKERVELLQSFRSWVHNDKTKVNLEGVPVDDVVFINQDLADAHLELKQYVLATQNFMNTPNMDGLLFATLRWAGNDNDAEVPFFLARTAMNLMCMSMDKLPLAEQLCSMYNAQRLGPKTCDHPLLHGLQLLLISLKHKDKKLFEAVKGMYGPNAQGLWGRDADGARKRFDRLEALFFNSGPMAGKENGGSGGGADLMSAVLGMLGGGGGK
eukprot:PhM_4_TR698/c0_g1_i1/m.9011